MATYNHILLAADLHPEDDDPVAEKAVALAKATGAKLSIIHVVEMIYNYGGPGNHLGILEWQEELKVAAENQLRELGKRLEIPKERQHIFIGSAKDWVLQEAESLDVDLIVVGSRRRTGLTSFLLGSTAEGVLHGAKCDVFAVQVTNVAATTANA